MSLKFKIFTALVVFVSFITFMILGFWQLDRMQEKSLLQKSQIKNQNLPPIEFDTFADYEEGLFRIVKLSGKWLAHESFFLDLRKYQGQTGLQLVMPFVTQGGKKVLVNRGWIAHKPAANSLPEIKTEQNPVSISGILTKAEPAKIDFSNSNELNKKRMFIAIDALKAKDNALSDALILQTRSEYEDGLIRDWKLRQFNPDMHLGYAIQWFAFAAILAVVSIYFMLKRK